jgi:hypothetical protein
MALKKRANDPGYMYIWRSEGRRYYGYVLDKTNSRPLVAHLTHQKTQWQDSHWANEQIGWLPKEFVL